MTFNKFKDVIGFFLPIFREIKKCLVMTIIKSRFQHSTPKT
uniref:Uncharacterized protein n=1 Tax=Colwellia sp. C1 TaxID=1737566 RepID=A0A0P0L7L5_9GAMM|nr:hypothetical protein [Colwellia sp. C1]